MAEGMSRAARRPALMPLVCGVIGLGAVVAGVSAVSLVAGDSTLSWRLMLAFLLIVAGWRLQCSVRVGGDRVVFFWGDAALVLSAGLIGPAWLIVVTAPAVGLALGVLPGRQPPVKAAYNSAAAVISSATAVGALTVVGATPLQLDSIRDVIGLGIAAVAYVVVSDLTTSAVVARHTGRPFWEVQGEGRLIQLVSLVGNLGGAAAVWITVALDPRLAVVAALAVLGAQQGYLGLRRVQHERRRRHELALAVSRLTAADAAPSDDLTFSAAAAANGDDMRCAESGVLRQAAGLALELFGADAVEIEVAVVDGPGLTWLYRRHLKPGADEEVGFGDATGQRLAADAVAPLGSGENGIGELRLGFVGAVRSKGLDEREQGDLAAFAAAIPAALLVAHRHTQERRLRARAEYQAHHDSLTGLANRRQLLDVAAHRLGGAEVDVRLTMLEVTGLRELARTVGHAAVDRLLVQVAQRITGAAENGELVARIDTGRFALLGITDTGSAAERLRQALSDPLVLSSGAVAVTTAIGGAAAPAPVGADELLRRAEVALAAAHSAPDRIAAYEQTVDVESLPRMMLVTRLRDGLRAGALEMAYRPARDLVSRAPTSVEAVPVWKDPQLGSFDTDDLLELASADVSGLHAAYVDWLLTTVLADCHRWAVRGAGMPVAVRLPRRSLLDPTLPSLVARHLSAAAVPADRLIVSVDDAMATATPMDVTGVVSGLADLGVVIAVDRLSLLEHLPLLPVDQLRLPAEVTSLVLTSPRAAALVEGTIATASRLGLQTTARGVDSEALATALRDMGCCAGQGDHIAIAMDGEQTGRYVWAAGVASEALHSPADVVVLARRRQRRQLMS